MVDTRFKKGRARTGGRPTKLKTQVKDFFKEHPYAVETLMKVLYEAGVDGDREAAIYVVDRFKGKPKAPVEIAGGEQIGEGMVKSLFSLMAERNRELAEARVKLLKEGDNAIQG